MKSSVITFEGVLERFSDKGGFHYVMFPYSVEELFGTRGSVRMKGTMNGIPVDRALMPRGNGTHFLIVSTEMRRKAGLRLGNKVHFSLVPDDRPDQPDLPEELSAALEMEPEAQVAFDQLNMGTKRNIAYWINSAKRPETRAQRTAEMLRRILSGYYRKPGSKGT